MELFVVLLWVEITPTAMPWWDRIAVINKLYDEGHDITYFTARGMGRFGDDPDASMKSICSII